MSQVESGVTTAQKVTPAGVATLRGRIAAKSRAISTKDGRRFVTVVKLPSPDEFTSPQTVEVRSMAALGDAGEVVSLKVQIGGYGRSYQVEDPSTGDKRSVQTADNSLTVVE